MSHTIDSRRPSVASRDERRVLHVLGPDPEDDLPPLETAERRDCAGERRRSRRSCARRTGPRGRRSSVASVGLDEIHRRRADELGDEEVPRALVEHLRRVDLLEEPAAHHRDAIAHRHRLGLVVRDVDGRDAEVALDARDLGAHLDAELRVEVRERLVHEERLRVADDRAAHRDPLPLAARERPRLLLQRVGEAEDDARPPGRAGRSRPSGTPRILSAKPMFLSAFMCG